MCKGETKGMAHCKKYNRAACGHMFKHYERAKDKDGEYLKFGNQDIDKSRTHLNYNLAPTQSNGQGSFVKKRCSEVKMQNRADVNVMCSWVVTAPKEIRIEETEKFFKETYNFLSERYGKDNVVSAHVHMDETTPHIHFAFVPVVKDKKKDILKVSAKEAIDKKELQIFHRDLSEYIDRVFGRDIGILNEATKEGNRSIEELKRETAQKELEKINQQIEENSKKLQTEIERMNNLKIEKQDYEKQIRELEKTFKGKTLTVENLENIKPVQGAFGLKNITLDEIRSLKSLAIGNAKKDIELEESKKEILRLEKINAEQKKRIPTMMQELERNKEIGLLKDENKRLLKNYNNISEKYNKLIGAVNQLGVEEIKLIKDMVEPPSGQEEKKRSKSRNSYER